MTENFSSAGRELPEELAAIDDAALQRLERFGGVKLRDEMITLFIEAAPARISAAYTGMSHGDRAAVELALHSLKSSAAQLGALRMQRLSMRGEALGRSGDLTEIPVLLSELEAEYRRVHQWLLQARDSGEAR